MPQQPYLTQQRIAWIVLALGFGLSCLNSLFIKRNIEEDAATNLAFAADQVTYHISERLAAYALVLRGASALFAASTDVTRDEWRTYYDILQVTDGVIGMQGIGFSVLIPSDQLAEHIEQIRAEGFTDYQVWPQGRRDNYTSVVYLEPFVDRNLRAFGYDMYSEPVRRAAMEHARDTGQATLSGKVVLVQETESEVQAGTLMYVPIYSNGAVLDTVEDRRNALIGWAYSPHRMTDMMGGILGGWDRVDIQALRLDIHDGFVPGQESLLYTNQAGEHMPHLPGLSIQRIIDFNGKQWRLEFDKLDAVRGMDYSRAWIGLFVGILLSTLLFRLIIVMARTQQHAQQIAEQLTLDINERNQQLSDSEQRWRFAIDGAGDGLWDWNLTDDSVFYSDRCKELLGIQNDPIDAIQEWKDRLHPDDKEATLAALNNYLEGRADFYTNEQRLRCDDGSYKWILERGAIVSRSPEGKPLRIIGTWSDIQDRKLYEIELYAAHAEARQFRDALDQVDSYIYIKDTQGRYTYANQATLDLFGVTAQELAGSTDSRFFQRETLEQLQKIDKQVLHGEETREEVEYIHPDGTRTVYLEIKTPIYDYLDKGRITGILGISTNITLLKDYQIKLERQAHHDVLTELPNRLLLVDRLTQAMSQAIRRKQSLALAYLDLDGFKEVNDRFGHAAGDKFLVTLSMRMKTALRQGDTLARLGGDEFVAVLLDVPDVTALKPVLQRFMEAINEPVMINGGTTRVTASMGVSFYPQGTEITPDELLQQADQTMYQAKQSGKNRVYVYGDTAYDNGGVLADHCVGL